MTDVFLLLSKLHLGFPEEPRDRIETVSNVTLVCGPSIIV